MTVEIDGEKRIVPRWDTAESLEEIDVFRKTILLKCGCKTGCTSNYCGCRKRGATCTLHLCTCIKCENTGTESETTAADDDESDDDADDVDDDADAFTDADNDEDNEDDDRFLVA